MYQRYTPKPDKKQPCLPPPRLKPPFNHSSHASMHSNTYKSNAPKHKNPTQTKNPEISANFLHGLIPPALYNPESKKILGLFSAEDMLLAALIFILLENSEYDNSTLIYALLYILISDYIDLPF